MSPAPGAVTGSPLPEVAPAIAASPASPAPARQIWDRCPVCAGAERSNWVRFEPLAFERCTGCGTVYKSFEEPGLRAGDFYEAAYHSRKRNRRWEHRVRKAMGQLRGAMQFGAVASVLDVGCSVGYVIEAGRRLGLRSAGTDVSSFAVETAVARGLLARVGELERLPFDDGEFELIVLRHVLEHTADPTAALTEVRRVLAPGGLALIAVPDLDYWKGQRRRETYRYFRPDDLGRQHFVYYTESSLRRLLEARGFRVLTSSKAFLGPRSSGGGPLPGLTARLAHAAKALVQWAARGLRMRRELYFVVRAEAPSQALPPG